MKTSKISNKTKLFLDYDYQGNGKYYTVEYGSRRYRNTSFENFRNSHPDCVKIVGGGNDAPRGGKTGNFVLVVFTPEFYKRFATYFTEREAERKRKAELEAEKEQFKIAVRSEADSIDIDDEFTSQMEWVMSVSGIEKSNRMASAVKSLLDRVGKEQIETDFWQVARILKSKANYQTTE